MGSQAQILRKQLEEELKKPYPDEDIVYSIRVRLPYANIVDTDRVNRGIKKLQSKPTKPNKKAGSSDEY